MHDVPLNALAKPASRLLQKHGQNAKARLVRWLHGWPSEQRLWDCVPDAARDVQRRFTSWADYAVHFRLSRNIWRGSNDRDQFAVIFDGTVKRLLTEAGSPRRSLP